MNITIFGAGNMGLACAGVLSMRNTVTLYTTQNHEQSETIALTYENAPVKCCTFNVTDDLSIACSSEVLLCTYPAFLRKKFVNSILERVSSGTIVGFIPGYGGVEYYSQALIKRGAIVFGLQRVPYVARSAWGARKASILSAKSDLYAAALPNKETSRICNMLEDLFSIPTHALPNYLPITLVPSNPLLHTSGVYGLFKDYEAGQTFSNQIMFYDAWDDDTSAFLLSYDDELQTICGALAPLDLSGIVSLRVYYEAPTPSLMTQKLKSIEAFKAVKAPLAQTNDGSFVPNWNDRMFVEDFPFGVALIKDVALLCKVETPTIDELLSFYRRVTGLDYFSPDDSCAGNRDSAALPSDFGLNTIDRFVAFYQD